MSSMSFIYEKYSHFIAMTILFFSAALAHIILRERLSILGIVGCVLCVVGSTTIVLHAPQEREIESVKEVWNLATEPGLCILLCGIAICLELLLLLPSSSL